jgi:hypothetical protein
MGSVPALKVSPWGLVYGEALFFSVNGEAGFQEAKVRKWDPLPDYRQYLLI